MYTIPLEAKMRALQAAGLQEANAHGKAILQMSNAISAEVRLCRSCTPGAVHQGESLKKVSFNRLRDIWGIWRSDPLM